jgi:hypothetical protein
LSEGEGGGVAKISSKKLFVTDACLSFRQDTSPWGHNVRHTGQPFKVVLDFGYPLGQAIYVSIAMLTLIISRKALGGIMREPMAFLLIALVVQYLSDFMFLYQVSNEQWYVGGLNDYMYLISYFLMTLGLIQLGATFQKIDES